MLLLFAMLGGVGGFLAGLLGVSSAVLMVPLLLYVTPLLGLPALGMKTVAGATMAQAFFASLAGALFYARHHHFDRPLVLWMGSSALIASFLGGVLSSYASDPFLLILFALLATAAAVLSFWRRHLREEEERPYSPRLAALLAFGVGLGAGMVGAGGAFLFLPLMLYVLRVPTRVAVGSSLGITLFSTAAGFLGKALTDQIPFPLATVLALSAVPATLLGGWFNRLISVQQLRLYLALLVALIAVRVWYDLATTWIVAWHLGV